MIKPDPQLRDRLKDESFVTQLKEYYLFYPHVNNHAAPGMYALSNYLLLMYALLWYLLFPQTLIKEDGDGV